MSTHSLDEIRYRINAGDREGARLVLVDLLEIDADNVDAWGLLAILLKDPAEQAECYRQILRIDPENRQAAVWLEALASQVPESTVQEKPFAPEGITLQCPTCGGVTEVRFVGELHDKRAFCPHCGSQIDLPDSFQRVERRREHETGPQGGSRTVESVRIETRHDHGPGESLPSGAEEIDQLLQALDLPEVDEELLRRLRERAASVETGKEVATSSGVRFQKQSFLERIMRRTSEDALDDKAQTMLAGGVDDLPKPGSLDPEDIIRLAGGALPPEERRECHNCGAVVSRSATRCPWCSVPLVDEGQG